MQFFLPVRTDAGPVSAVFHQLFCPNPDSARKRNDTQKAHDSAALAVINGLILKQQHLSVLYPAASGKANGTLSPHPDDLTSEAAIITSAAAGTADRVIAYFDKEVNAEDFMKDGYPDTTKFDCKIRTGMDSAFTPGTGRELPIVAVLPVANEKKALEILVATPLQDNANASVTFKDKRVESANIDTTNTVNFRLADAREPSVLSVEANGTKKIEITFSEAVLPYTGNGNIYTDVTDATVSGFPEDQYAAQNLDNYLIDGKKLTDFGIVSIEREKEISDISSTELDRTTKQNGYDETFRAKDGKVTLQSYKVTDKVGADNRNKVIITVGSGHVLPTGTHMLTVKNVGDWAARTDSARNSVSTQVLPFTVTENAQKPEFTVNVQSPEQFELNFNTEFKVADEGDRFVTPDSSVELQDSVLELQEKINGTWTTISNSTTAMESRGQNPVMVSRVGYDEKKFLVEVKRDWSDVYNFDSTRTDYYNKSLRLHVAAGKLVNVSNNLRNDEINIELNANDAKVTNGNIMGGADLESPTVVGIKQATAKNGALLNSWNVELSEPVKISSDANKEGLTPSQKQSKGVKNAEPSDKLKKNQGVPVAFARFVNVDSPGTIIEGIVDESGFVDAEDKVINVAPEKKLPAGSWRLVVGSISDDYGSTLATAGDVIVIDETTAATDFKVVWAAVSKTKKYDTSKMGNVDDGYQRGSYVFVKFNKAVDMATALDENNYTLNNQPLPHGSNIYANIEHYDDQDGVLDSVTIALPTNSSLLYNNYDVSTISTQLSINGVVAQGTNEVLSGSSMNQLPYNIAESSRYNSVSTETDNLTATEDAVRVSGLSAESDAVWGNHTSERLTEDGETGIKTWPEYYEALRAALDNDQYRKVLIDPRAFAGIDSDTNNRQADAARAVFGKNLILEINRAIDVVDFNSDADTCVDFWGNIVVSTADAVHSMTIKNVNIHGTKEEVRGDNASLTVNAGFVRHFVLSNVNVYSNRGDNNETSNAINLINVYKDSFEPDGQTSINDSQTRDNKGVIYVTDGDGFGFTNNSQWTGHLIINSAGDINLKEGFAHTNITVEQAATLNLGTVNENGSVIEKVTLDGATIRITGAEAKVMITAASQTNPNAEAPEILIAAKDVKVYAETSNKGGWVKNDNGTIIEIDEKGKKRPENVNITNYDENLGGMKKLLSELTVLEGREEDKIAYADYRVISGGSIFGEASSNESGSDLVINRAKAATDVVTRILAAANKKTEGVSAFLKADGTDLTTDDLRVTVSLAASDGKKLQQNTNEITLKENPQSGSDIIVISLTYAGNTYKRNITITD